jgi:hypothetical protein
MCQTLIHSLRLFLGAKRVHSLGLPKLSYRNLETGPGLGCCFFFVVVVFAVLGFELRDYTLSHPTSPFL